MTLQWAAELETAAARPAAPVFSHAPTGGADAAVPALQSPEGRRRSAAKQGVTTEQEEQLLRELSAAMEGLSDEASSEDEAEPQRREGREAANLERGKLERRDSQKKSMASMPTAGGARRGLSLAALGFALLFVHKLRTKFAPVAMAEDEVRPVPYIHIYVAVSSARFTVGRTHAPMPTPVPIRMHMHAGEPHARDATRRGEWLVAPAVTCRGPVRAP